jgi:imidazole glycerol-phosphate synthase subunit HisH
MSLVAVIDYGSGNLRSVAKAFEAAASTLAHPPLIKITRDPHDIRKATQIVLPGVGAFADCYKGLTTISGLLETLEAAVFQHNVPFLGICVGMQLMASFGVEYGKTPGLGWIKGEILPLKPREENLKIPHMGWNNLSLHRPHPIFKEFQPTDPLEAYFVHSFAFVPEDPQTIIADIDYGGQVVAALGRDNLVGTQFHPEKSQQLGLKILRNFLLWKP